MRAHRVALLGLGAWAYAGAAAWASSEGWSVAAITFAAMSLTCVALIPVNRRVR
jgi:hypothetical protein